VPTVTVYTKPFCPYCSRAIALLEKKGAQVDEIIASMDPAKRAEMMHRSGRATYPQIFVGEVHVGGCDDLYALEAKGGLDPLLDAPASRGGFSSDS
jgi:glutaredoxin 3